MMMAPASAVIPEPSRSVKTGDTRMEIKAPIPWGAISNPVATGL